MALGFIVNEDETDEERLAREAAEAVEPTAAQLPAVELDPARFPTEGIPSEQRQDDIFAGGVDRSVSGLILEQSIGAAGIRRIADETVPLARELSEGRESNVFDFALAGSGALFGFTADEPNYTKADHSAELLEGIPWNLHDDIMDHNNLEAAHRARARILGKMTSGQQMAAQGAHFNPLYLLDIDAPLGLLTGGSFTAVRAASKAAAVARNLGASLRGQRRIAAISQGIVAGAESGMLVSAGGVTWDETFGWAEAAQTTLAGAIMGGGLSVAGAPRAGNKDLMDSLTRTVDDLDAQLVDQNPALSATVGDEALPNIVTPNEVLELTPALGADGPLKLTPELRADDSMSIGARALDPSRQSPATDLSNDPAGNVSDTNKAWSNMADEWADDSGYRERRIADMETDPMLRAMRDIEKKIDILRQRGGTAGEMAAARAEATLDRVGVFGHSAVGNGFANRLWTSNSTLLNFAGGVLFESANGLGRGSTTSSILNELYTKRIASPMRALHGIRSQWAQANTGSFLNTGYGVSSTSRRAFDRAVRLELNAREKGRPTTSDDLIRRAADEQSKISVEAANVARGRDGERAVDGFEDVADNANWQSYTWSGRAINRILTNGVLAATAKQSRQILMDVLAKSYRDAGMGTHKDAQIIAEAVITRALRREHSVETSVHGLLNRDGQDFMDDTLRMNGVDEATRAGIMSRLVGDKQEGAQEGFTKSRNEVDLETGIPTLDGSELRIVDLINDDLARDTHTYVRKVAGASALARNGLTNRAMRDEFVAAAQAQQRSIGEVPIDAREMQAMFSHFDGGGIKGWAFNGEAAMADQSSVMLRRAANLAYLGKLGLTQLGETGAIVAQAGVRNFYNRSIKTWYDKAAKDGRDVLMQDVGFITGEVGYDHLVSGEQFGLDDVTDSTLGNQFMQGLDNKIKDATYIQGYISGFNVVRGQQQKIAASAMIDSLFQRLRSVVDSDDVDVPDELLGRMWNDLGIDSHTAKRLTWLIEDGTIEFSPEGFVNRINSSSWDGDLQDIIGSSIHRNQAQVVQKSLAGEQDAWMNTSFLGLLTHLKTFPLAAVNKGARRHLRNHDMAAVSAVMWGLGTATAAVVLRNAVSGREQDPEQIARSAVQYSNMTGWAVLGSDTIMTILGMDNLKVNPYAGRGDLAPPALAWLGDAMKLPGAVGDVFNGDGVSGTSRKAFRALPFANVVGFSNAIGALD